MDETTSSTNTNTKVSRSFPGVRMFGSKPNDLTRSVSRDLGCYSYDGTGCAPLQPEDDDAIFMRLEGGLFGVKNDETKENLCKTGDFNGSADVDNAGRSYFPFQRKKQVGRTTSDQTMDPDQFLWSENNNESSSISTK
jgi:hypothetical protein